MNLGDARYRFSEFWSEFRKETSGLVGLAILIISLLTVILEPAILPWKATNGKWRSIDYWQDNSSSAPPAWTNWFAKLKSPVTQKLTVAKRDELDQDGGVKMVTSVLSYDYQADKAPLDVIFHITGTGDLPIAFSIERPDGLTIDLAQRFEQGLSGQDIRISTDNDAKDAAFAFAKLYESEQALENSSSRSMKPTELIFNTAGAGMASEFKPLKGQYKFIAKTMILDTVNFKVQEPTVVVTGSVSGILGTDDSKRDLFSGLVAGLKWALLIGLLTSAISVIIGVLYGIIEAYFGGMVDSVMQFVYQIVNSIPVLPVLIVISAIFKPNIFFLILVMVIFFWTGSVMTVRSMALQIKEETYIEAARALGASNGRIIFKHMMPILIPYSFASMALSVPSAIVYESSVSLLGLGDATIVTWGQILHDAMQGSAILNGQWWWVLPPGLLIAIMGMTFAFLGFSMDKILHPKLKTR
ncbi:MAG: ABC transporter permease [Spirochaetes bacterium]|nr:ABC transporter permease [Spirochaetota bacterium]